MGLVEGKVVVLFYITGSTVVFYSGLTVGIVFVSYFLSF